MKLGFSFGAAATLFLVMTSAVAQPVSPPMDTEQSEAATHAAIPADVAEIRANARASAVTREQIQQLRRALKAKLAALRH